MKNASEGPTLGFSGFETQGRHHQKSKPVVSVAPQKGLMSSKEFLERKKILTTKEVAHPEIVSW